MFEKEEKMNIKNYLIAGGIMLNNLTGCDLNPENPFLANYVTFEINKKNLDKVIPLDDEPYINSEGDLVELVWEDNGIVILEGLKLEKEIEKGHHFHKAYIGKEYIALQTGTLLSVIDKKEGILQTLPAKSIHKRQDYWFTIDGIYYNEDPSKPPKFSYVTIEEIPFLRDFTLIEEGPNEGYLKYNYLDQFSRF